MTDWSMMLGSAWWSCSTGSWCDRCGCVGGSRVWVERRLVRHHYARLTVDATLRPTRHFTATQQVMPASICLITAS